MPITGNIMNHYCSQIYVLRILYSCGNRVFAVDRLGKLIWKTDIIEASPGYTFNTNLRFSPAIVPDTKVNTQLLIVVNTNSTHLFALSSSNGTVIGSYKLPTLVNGNGLYQPPLVASNRVYWIMVQYDYTKFYLYSIPINDLLNKL